MTQTELKFYELVPTNLRDIVVELKKIGEQLGIINERLEKLVKSTGVLND